jgi:hypothetical protein
MSTNLFTNPYKIKGPRGALGAKGDRGPHGLPGIIGPTGDNFPAPIPGSGVGLTKYDLFKIYHTYTGSFTVPDDVAVMYVTALGAGGGGGGGWGYFGGGGGGGGGSGFIWYEFSGVGGKTVGFKIGQGGNGGISVDGSGHNVGQNGSNGGNSSITLDGLTYSALGGIGGGGGGVNDHPGSGGNGGGYLSPSDQPYPVGQAGGGPSTNGSGITNYSVYPLVSGGGGGGGSSVYGSNILGGGSLYQVQPPVTWTYSNCGIGGASFLGVSVPNGDFTKSPAPGAGGRGGFSPYLSSNLVNGVNGGDGVVYVYY